MTTWSEHARHHILTCDFDATLISETHLRRDGPLSAVTEANKSGWSGAGSAATNIVNNGTSAGVLTLVRKRWFSKPLSICSDDAGILCPSPRLAGRVIRVMGREILLLTAYFEHSAGFRSDINANLIHDVCFLTRDRRYPFILGRISTFRHPCGRICLYMEEASGSSSWVHRSFLKALRTRVGRAEARNPASSITSWCRRAFGP